MGREGNNSLSSRPAEETKQPDLTLLLWPGECSRLWPSKFFHTHRMDRKGDCSPGLQLLLAQGFSPAGTLQGLGGFGVSESPLKHPGAVAEVGLFGTGFLPRTLPASQGDRLCLPTLQHTQSFLWFMPLMLFSVWAL